LADQPQLLAELGRYGVTGLGISIDGMKETHDSFRRMAGSWAKAVTAARRAVECGFVVTVSLVAHANNVDEIPTFFNFVRREIRPRVFRIMTLDPLGRAATESDYLPSAEQLRRVIAFLHAEYERDCFAYANPNSTMVELGCGGWLGMELEGAVRPFIFHCIAGITNLGILHDGKLASCSNISRQFIEGDCRKEQIKMVWDTRYQRYRDFAWKRTGDCARCDQWCYCHGGPMHTSHVRSRNRCLCSEIGATNAET
jgi:radical SAM protein with 4Fe4S-binding SPASM domain